MDQKEKEKETSYGADTWSCHNAHPQIYKKEKQEKQESHRLDLTNAAITKVSSAKSQAPTAKL